MKRLIEWKPGVPKRKQINDTLYTMLRDGFTIREYVIAVIGFVIGFTATMYFLTK